MRWGALLALLWLSACHRERYFVVHVDVSNALWPQETSLVTPSEVKRVFLSQVARIPGLQQVNEEQVPKDAPRYALDFTPALLGSPTQGGAVVATLTVRRAQGGFAARYPMEVEVQFAGGVGPARVQAALEQATARVVDTARLQMAALEAPVRKLREDLASNDPRVRSFAVARLAETHDPAAVPGLRAALKSADPDEVRRAIGGLVELRDRGAVPELIEVAHGRPPEFQREVIYALGEIGGDEARGYLYTISEGADLEPLRAAAKEALQELEARNPPQGAADSRAEEKPK